MEYSKLVAVTGLPGLFELINSKGDGAIVRSLEDQSTKFISSRVHNFSHLDSIEAYTVRENVPLAEVFLAIKSSNQKLPDEKDANEVRKFFEKVYPDLDFDRVYNSDLKKMVRWYAVLQQHNIDIQLPQEETEENPEASEEPGSPVEEPVIKETEKKPAKKSRKK